MSDTITLERTQDRALILPEALCARYGLQPGDTLTLLDLGEVFVLSPRRSQIAGIAGGSKEELTRQGETQESLRAATQGQRDTGTC